MKLLLSITVLLCLLILLLFFLSCNFNQYFRTKWPEILILFFSVSLGVLATIFGVYLTIEKDIQKSRDDQEDLFKRTFSAILTESAFNQAVLIRCRDAATSRSTFLSDIVLDDSVSTNLLTNPLLYKYTGREYFMALKAYHAQTSRMNKVINGFTGLSLSTVPKLSPSQLENLTKLVDEYLYHCYILQYQTQHYIFALDVRTGPVPDNQTEILSWLQRHPQISLDELKARLSQQMKLDEKERARLRDAYHAVLHKRK